MRLILYITSSYSFYFVLENFYVAKKDLGKQSIEKARHMAFNIMI